MASVSIAGEPHDDSPRVVSPVGRIESGECRHKVYAAVVVRVGHSGRRFGTWDNLELLDKPLDAGPCKGDRPFKRVRDAVILVGTQLERNR